MPPLRDYQVRFTREEEIAAIALEWRKEAGNENSAEFNIVEFIENVLAKKIRKKGPLHVDFFQMQYRGDPAYVTFEPLTLHVDSDVWHRAKLGDPECRYILAHEAGHLILHDHHAKAFSNDGSVNIKFATKECSAEWQASVFAAYFLLPDHIVLANMNATDLTHSCSVPRQVAEDRVSAVAEAMKPRSKIEGDFCIVCGEFTNRKTGSNRCPTCGN
jgi:Zn-dependent peptidase ImmA (M78 family)